MSCLTGESSAIDSALGPRFTRELLASLSQAPAGEWPDFEHALREAAAALHADPALAQSATLIAGDDWQGLPLLGRGLEGRRLIDVLGDIDWSYERFKPYLLRALPAQTLVQMPADLQAGIELLQGLLPLAGVPPVLDFAERVARASGLDALRDWVDLRLSKHQRAELASRLSKSGYRARLRLWYRDEAEPPSIEAELDIIDAGAGAPPWQRAAAKPTAPGTVCGTVGQWVQAAYNHLGRQDGELVVELYLPRGLLAADAYDTARVPLDGGDEMQLGHELPTLLRCTDRYKSHAKLGRLRRHGPSILARLGADASQGLRWALPQDTADGLHQAFVAPASACVWLGFEAQGAGGHQPLAHALEVGLPAVLWLRAQAQAAAWAAAQPSLQTLLNSPLAELPARLAVWRDAQVDAAARNVAVLLDDPAQLPALLNQWLQPGG